VNYSYIAIKTEIKRNERRGKNEPLYILVFILLQIYWCIHNNNDSWSWL